MRTLLIHNESAGAGQLSPKELTTALEAGGLVVRHCSPNDPEIDRHLAEPVDLVVVAGGDGTVARMLARLPFSQRDIAIVPLGTANNIAQSLGILDTARPGTGNEIVTAWRDADRRSLDVGLATGPWGEQRFIEAVGIGPLARIILQFKTEDVSAADSIRLGREAFRRALAEAEPLQSTITVDGKELAGEFLLVEIMNIRHAGARLPLAPMAEIGDGLFEIVTISASERGGVLDWLEKGAKGAPPLSISAARSVTIDWRGEPLRIDDFAPTVAVPAGRLEITFVAERLEILVPPPRDRATDERMHQSA